MADRPNGLNPFLRGLHPRRREKRNRPVSGRTSMSAKGIPKPAVLPPICTGSLTTVGNARENQPTPDVRPRTSETSILVKNKSTRADGRGHGDSYVPVASDEAIVDRITTARQSPIDDARQRIAALENTVALHQKHLIKLNDDRNSQKDYLRFLLGELSQLEDHTESVSTKLLEATAKSKELRGGIRHWDNEQTLHHLQFQVTEDTIKLLKRTREDLIKKSETNAVEREERHLALQQKIAETREKQPSDDRPPEADKTVENPGKESLTAPHSCGSQQLVFPTSPTDLLLLHPVTGGCSRSRTEGTLTLDPEHHPLNLQRSPTPDAQPKQALDLPMLSAKRDNYPNPLRYRVRNSKPEKPNLIDGGSTGTISASVCARKRQKTESCFVNKNILPSRSFSASPTFRVRSTKEAASMSLEPICDFSDCRPQSEQSNRSQRNVTNKFDSCLSPVHRPIMRTKSRMNDELSISNDDKTTSNTDVLSNNPVSR